MTEDERRENERDEETNDERRGISLADHAVVLIIVLAIALVGNFLGPDMPLLGAVPGMMLLYAIVLVGLVLTKYAPFYLPSVAWISLVGIVATLPFVPGSGWIVGQVEEVDFLALATPVLAYAGLAITRSEAATFRTSGWKLVIIAFLVFAGTFLASAAIAQVTLTLQGQI
jgi:hypothetical protein